MATGNGGRILIYFNSTKDRNMKPFKSQIAFDTAVAFAACCSNLFDSQSEDLQESYSHAFFGLQSLLTNEFGNEVSEEITNAMRSAKFDRDFLTVVGLEVDNAKSTLEYKAGGTMVQSRLNTTEGTQATFVILVMRGESDFVVSRYSNGYSEWQSGTYFTSLSKACKYFDTAIEKAEAFFK